MSDARTMCRDCRELRPVDHDCPERGRQDAIEAAGLALSRARIPAASRRAS